MPSSKQVGKSNIKEFIESKNIKTVLDIGIGEGTYARLLGKDYYYIGVEIFPDYIDMFKLDDLYNQIIIGDASATYLPKADCIIFGDVLEHIEKNKSMELLKNALEAYKHVIISVPLGYYPGKTHYGNKYEAHISQWEYEEIEPLAEWEVKIKSQDIGIFCK